MMISDDELMMINYMIHIIYVLKTQVGSKEILYSHRDIFVKFHSLNELETVNFKRAKCVISQLWGKIITP